MFVKIIFASEGGKYWSLTIAVFSVNAIICWGSIITFDLIFSSLPLSLFKILRFSARIEPHEFSILLTVRVYISPLANSCSKNNTTTLGFEPSCITSEMAMFGML